jgi:hypothetical protein
MTASPQYPEPQMVNEIQTLYSRLDKLPLTPADRALGKARLEQGDAIAAARLERLFPGSVPVRMCGGLKHSDSRA